MPPGLASPGCARGGDRDGGVTQPAAAAGRVSHDACVHGGRPDGVPTADDGAPLAAGAHRRRARGAPGERLRRPVRRPLRAARARSHPGGRRRRGGWRRRAGSVREGAPAVAHDQPLRRPDRMGAPGRDQPDPRRPSPARPQGPCPAPARRPRGGRHRSGGDRRVRPAARRAAQAAAGGHRPLLRRRAAGGRDRDGVGIAEGSVKSHLHDARRRLRPVLEREAAARDGRPGTPLPPPTDDRSRARR